MIIGEELQKQFPQCAHYIKTFLSDPRKFQAGYPGVWDAFIKACKIELPSENHHQAEVSAKEILTLGRGPEVQLFNSKKDCGLFHPGVRFFSFSYQKYIKISIEATEAYEHGTGWKVLEGTLLHESVHWVRFKAAGTAHFISGNNGDFGSLFEKWAYGFKTCIRSKPGAKLLQIGPPGTAPRR